MGCPLKRLTAPQRECLRLVAELKSSKEIAIELGLSSHAIDARLKRTLATLGVSTRQEAARLYLDSQSRTYQPLVCPSSDVFDAALLGDEGASPEKLISDDRPIGVLHAPAFAGGQHSPVWSIALPFRTNERPVNELSWSARLAWMSLILVATVFAVTLLISTVEGLSRLL